MIGFAAAGCGGDGPTEPKSVSLSELFGNQLYRADGSQVGIGSISSTPVIGLYFASPGCPACGGFTPVLVDAYGQLRDDGRPFEVVLVSPSINDLALFEYMVDSGMPWLAVSSDSGKAKPLLDRYDIRWVPTLLILDAAGNLLSRTGREELSQEGVGAYDDWLAGSSGGR
jgi:hypothetical protein